jgi:hypothetical protein
VLTRRRIAIVGVIVLAIALWFVAIRDRASERQVRAAAMAATHDRAMTCSAQDSAAAVWFCFSESGGEDCVRVSVSLTGTIHVGRPVGVCERP